MSEPPGLSSTVAVGTVLSAAAAAAVAAASFSASPRLLSSAALTEVGLVKLVSFVSVLYQYSAPFRFLIKLQSPALPIGPESTAAAAAAV